MVLPSFARSSPRRPLHRFGSPWLTWAIGLGACLVLCVAVAAAEPPPAVPAALRAVAERIEAHKEALARANAAVVGVEVTAIEDARSIATLGKERQGSGILIGDEGLVLTIGYLILEADHVDLVPADGRRVPARVVAYDLASGFGLVQALAPLGLMPVRLGVSSAIADDEPLLIASGGDEADLSIARMVSRRAVVQLGTSSPIAIAAEAKLSARFGSKAMSNTLTKRLPRISNKGTKTNQSIVDSTAKFAAKTLQSGLHAGITSPARPWFKLGTPDPDLAEFGPVKEWLHIVTQRMYAVLAGSNAYNGLHSLYLDYGLFGVSPMALFVR